MIELVNNHVLLPHRANWSGEVAWQRGWQSDVATGIEGQESRAALRAHARVTLKYLISPKTLQERVQLEARITAALKSGFACVPYVGRASVLAAPCTLNTATIQPSPWPWVIGDYVFLMDQQRRYEIAQIDDVVDDVNLVFTANVTRTYAARLAIWPLLFGRLAESTMEAITAHHGDIPITITENVSRESVTLGVYTPPPPDEDLAIPDMEIGTSFIVR